MELLRRHAEQIFLAGIKAVFPRKLVTENLTLNTRITPNAVKIGNKSFDVSHNVYVVGFGKATISMARAVEDVLNEHVVRGIINIPFGCQQALRSAHKTDLLLAPNTKIQIFEGAKNNLPDVDALNGAKKIVQLVQQLGETDLLIVLISGGGSALFPFPIPPITLDEKTKVIRLLSNRGATIQELNTVRQHISLVKGGGLAQIAYPAQVLSLILSDVANDPLEFIASGPTVPSSSTAEIAIEILNKYNLFDETPTSVSNMLTSADQSSSSESFDHVNNFVIGNNRVAVDDAKRQAESLGYQSFFLSNAVQGNSRILGQFLVDLAMKACSRDILDQHLYDLCATLNIPQENLEKLVNFLNGRGNEPLCIITAGETTVDVTGSGVGGRNQEMVLASCIALQAYSSANNENKLIILSAGTDGIDGPTTAAGSITYMKQYTDAMNEGLNPETYLKNNDSHSFYKLFSQGRDLIITDHTGTNVMDIQVVLVLRNKSAA